MIQTLNGHGVRWKSVRWGRGGGWLDPGLGGHLMRGHPAALDRHPNHIHHFRGSQGMLDPQGSRESTWQQCWTQATTRRSR